MQAQMLEEDGELVDAAQAQQVRSGGRDIENVQAGMSDTPSGPRPRSGARRRPGSTLRCGRLAGALGVGRGPP